MAFEIPPPQRSRVTLSLAGFQHVSPYTNTAIASVTFGSRRVWKCSYIWDVSTVSDNDKLETFLLRLGAGRGTIPLYFFAGGDGAARKNIIKLSKPMNDMNGEEGAITGVTRSTISFSNDALIQPTPVAGIGSGALKTPFGLQENYNLQVGNFCLRVIGVSGNTITVANMPVDPITGQSNLMSRVIDAPDAVRNYDFFMIGKNVSFDVGHEESVAASGTYLPDPIEFIEVL